MEGKNGEEWSFLEETEEITGDMGNIYGIPPKPHRYEGACTDIIQLDKINEGLRERKRKRFFYLAPERLETRRLKSISDSPCHRDVGIDGSHGIDIMA